MVRIKCNKIFGSIEGEDDRQKMYEFYEWMYEPERTLEFNLYTGHLVLANRIPDKS